MSQKAFTEALSYFPEHADYRFGPHQYLDLIARAGEAVDIPVIASLNGTTDEGWISYARSIEEAGAKGLELNIYFIPADISMSGRDVEKRYIDIVKTVRKTVKIPVAVKLSPYFSSIGHMAKAIEKAGADALVLFNRFYQPDLDLAELKVHSRPEALDARRDPAAAPLARRALGRMKASLAATTGVDQRRRGGEISARRRRRRDVDLRASSPRRGLHGDAGLGAGALADGAGVPVARRGARADEPAAGR